MPQKKLKGGSPSAMGVKQDRQSSGLSQFTERPHRDVRAGCGSMDGCVQATIHGRSLAACGSPNAQDLKSGSDSRCLQRESLKGTVVITRPLHQAQSLAYAIQQLGGDVIIFPTLEILPIENNEKLQNAANHMDEYDIAIFVSANAVRYFLKSKPSLLDPAIESRDDTSTLTIAVGPGTAQALNAGQIKAIFPPENHSSEGILALKELQNIKLKKIAIFCGENSKPLLKTLLQERGAQVQEIICYRRHCPNANAKQIITAWQEAGVNYIISTSAENLQNLYFIFAKIDSAWMLHTPLVVISNTLSALAQQLGFQSIIEAQGASDEAICKALLLRNKTIC